jgi:hypothetical protein
VNLSIHTARAIACACPERRKCSNISIFEMDRLWEAARIQF